MAIKRYKAGHAIKPLKTGHIPVISRNSKKNNSLVCRL